MPAFAEYLREIEDTFHSAKITPPNLPFAAEEVFIDRVAMARSSSRSAAQNGCEFKQRFPLLNPSQPPLRRGGDFIDRVAMARSSSRSAAQNGCEFKQRFPLLNPTQPPFAGEEILLIGCWRLMMRPMLQVGCMSVSASVLSPDCFKIKMTLLHRRRRFY